ncbi:MAG: FtsQ-type POTRA domain-containing protein [Clostridia bacterium]|nr:FtsQ-type POTRA domain-containing protein [Clostridia bacterium]
MDKRHDSREKVKKRPVNTKTESKSPKRKPPKTPEPFAKNDGLGNEARRENTSAAVGKKTQQRRMVSGLYVAAAVIVVTVALTWAFTAFFTVSEINVYGAGKLSAEEIIELSGIDYGDSLILINKQKIEKNIVGKSIYIEGVTVKRLFPDTVELTVTDKTVAAAFEANGAYWLVSGNGTLLELSLNRPKDALVIRGAKLVDSRVGNRFNCEDEAKQIILEEILDALEEYSLEDFVGSVDITHTYAVVMTYDDCFDIILGDADNIRSDCAKINTVVGKIRADGGEYGCIDMRDGSIRFTTERWKKNILD